MKFEECEICNEIVDLTVHLNCLQNVGGENSLSSKRLANHPNQQNQLTPYKDINPQAKKCIPLNYFSQRDSYSCGYQNLKMLLSSLNIYYSITELQEIIQKAWSLGWDLKGKQELGMVLDRKIWIGTPEVYICLAYLGIKTIIYDFAGGNPSSEEVHPDLRIVIESHFESKDPYPLYFQYHGHSQTIVGVYKQSILLFDPAKSKTVPYPIPFSRLRRKQYQIIKVLGNFTTEEERQATKTLKSISFP